MDADKVTTQIMLAREHAIALCVMADERLLPVRVVRLQMRLQIVLTRKAASTIGARILLAKVGRIHFTVNLGGQREGMRGGV